MVPVFQPSYSQTLLRERQLALTVEKLLNTVFGAAPVTPGFCVGQAPFPLNWYTPNCAVAVDENAAEQRERTSR